MVCGCDKKKQGYIICNGNILIRLEGTLSLINNANVTVNGIEIDRTGDSVFITRGTRLITS